MFTLIVLALAAAFLVLPRLMVRLEEYTRMRDDNETVERSDAHRRAQWQLFGFVAVLIVASLAFRVMTGTGLDQTAALFVGIPAMLAMAAVFITPAQSATGVACKVVTIGLLISLIFLGEEVLWVLTSAPLFYLVAVLVGRTIDEVRNKDDRFTHKTSSWLAVLAIVPMSLEAAGYLIDAVATP